MKGIKEKYPTMFSLAFMCQGDIDPDTFLNKLPDPEQLFLNDVLLLLTDTNEGIFMLALIQTLAKW